MRSVRGGTRLTFPHHFTVTLGRQAGSHAGGALSPELVDLFGIALPLPRSCFSAAGVCLDGGIDPPPAALLGYGHPRAQRKPAPHLRTELRSSERHAQNPEAAAQLTGIARPSPSSRTGPEPLQPFVNQVRHSPSRSPPRKKFQ